MTLKNFLTLKIIYYSNRINSETNHIKKKELDGDGGWHKVVVV